MTKEEQEKRLQKAMEELKRCQEGAKKNWSGNNFDEWYSWVRGGKYEV